MVAVSPRWANSRWVDVDTAIQASSVSVRRFSSIEFLVALTFLLVSYPFVDKLANGHLIESILFTIVLVSAILTMAGRGRVLAIATLLAIPTVVARWFNHFRPDWISAEIFLGGGIVFLVFIIAQFIRFIARAPRVDGQVLCAAISAYLLLGLTWTFGYWLVAEVVPGAFAFNAAAAGDQSIEGFNGFYFSFITLSTVGYGDITPACSAARMLAASEATTGLLYVAVLISRLVALLAIPKSRNEN